MRIQVLFFDGCPNYRAAIDLVRAVAPHATIEELEVKTTDNAERIRFLGSPTILVDGVDIEPGARTRTDFGFSCRTYNGAGVPSQDVIVSAIADARNNRLSFERSGSVWLSAGSVLVAAMASVCCWLPLVLLAFGTSAAGWLRPFETAQPWFFAGSATLLVVGFYLAYRKQPCCSPACNRTMAWIAAAAVLAFALVTPNTGVFVNAVVGTTCCTSPETNAPVAQQGTPSHPGEAEAATSSGTAATLTVLSDDVHELKDAFNADKDAVKVMMIVSPVCPMCRSGARVVQEQALAKIDGDKLKIYVVWTPRFPGDNRDQAEKATQLVSDKRARHFWDGRGKLGRQYGKIVELPRQKNFAWDVYFVFDADAKWEENPPIPDFWMHQLGGRETGNVLDGERFREAIRQRLSR